MWQTQVERGSRTIRCRAERPVSNDCANFVGLSVGGPAVLVASPTGRSKGLFVAVAANAPETRITLNANERIRRTTTDDRYTAAGTRRGQEHGMDKGDLGVRERRLTAR